MWRPIQALPTFALSMPSMTPNIAPQVPLP
jgi:hypothetical protein